MDIEQNKQYRVTNKRPGGYVNGVPAYESMYSGPFGPGTVIPNGTVITSLSVQRHNMCDESGKFYGTETYVGVLLEGKLFWIPENKTIFTIPMEVAE